MVSRERNTPSGETSTESDRLARDEEEKMKSLDELRIPGIKPRRMQEAVDGSSWLIESREKEKKDCA